MVSKGSEIDPFSIDPIQFCLAPLYTRFPGLVAINVFQVEMVFPPCV